MNLKDLKKENVGGLRLEQECCVVLAKDGESVLRILGEDISKELYMKHVKSKRELEPYVEDGIARLFVARGIGYLSFLEDVPDTSTVGNCRSRVKIISGTYHEDLEADVNHWLSSQVNITIRGIQFTAADNGYRYVFVTYEVEV